MEINTQLDLLRKKSAVPPFEATLAGSGLQPLFASSVEILQMNITRRCNMACKHCHVQAGAGRSEMMERRTFKKCLRIAAHPSLSTIDITGGAPETHPDLAWMLEALASLDKRVIVRTNLTILLSAGCRHLPGLYARHGIEIVASLPDCRGERTNRQRGPGSFEKSIAVLQQLNSLGYGIEGTGLVLDLMHNPAGAYLPAQQEALEQEYKTQLARNHGVHFNKLFCLTNCPVGRYLEYLVQSDNLEDYLVELAAAYNPFAAANAMCRTMLSVGWDGTLYDCDFNQMLGLQVDHGAPSHLDAFDFKTLARRQIVTGNHCYSCTAGAGSSCQGATEKNFGPRKADCGMERRLK